MQLFLLRIQGRTLVIYFTTHLIISRRKEGNVALILWSVVVGFGFWFLVTVVWGAGWTAGSLLESCRSLLQLHIPPFWCCHSAHCMCQVSQPKPTPIVMLLADQLMDPWWFLNPMWFNSCFNYNSNMSFWACSQSLNSCIAKHYMYHNGHQQLWGFVFPPLSGFCSNIFLLNDHLDKREWTYIFGACCMLTVLVPTFRNYRLWSFFGLVMISYTAWYMTIAALAHGQVGNTLANHPLNIYESLLKTFTTFFCFVPAS